MAFVEFEKVSKIYHTGAVEIPALRDATFQVESGDRMEFSVSGREYGLLVEGDTGRLTFQGTRSLGFAQR